MLFRSNDGYVHDNVLLKGVVYNDDAVYGDEPEDTSASGATGKNLVLSADELRGNKAAEAIALLNLAAQGNGWESYWIRSKDTTASGENAGYPLLSTQNPWGAGTPLASAQLNITL